MIAQPQDAPVFRSGRNKFAQLPDLHAAQGYLVVALNAYKMDRYMWIGMSGGRVKLDLDSIQLGYGFLTMLPSGDLLNFG